MSEVRLDFTNKLGLELTRIQTLVNVIVLCRLDLISLASLKVFTTFFCHMSLPHILLSSRVTDFYTELVNCLLTTSQQV